VELVSFSCSYLHTRSLKQLSELSEQQEYDESYVHVSHIICFSAILDTSSRPKKRVWNPILKRNSSVLSLAGIST
jgi:hypothetical protein